MNNMPKKLREELEADPGYKICARLGSDCSGRITFEHAEMYRGRQIQEIWNIVPLCVYHHLGEGLNKRWNKDYAMNRATEEDKKKYPKLKWRTFA